MFGIMFKNLNGRKEMAIRRIFSSKTHAETVMKVLIANLGPALQKRYAVVELKTI